MQIMKKLMPLFLLPLLLVSCADTEINNLTPSQYPRNPSGQYLVEMSIETTQKTLRPKTVTPYVIVGFNQYPMRKTLKTDYRWEALVPIGADQNSIDYHFKVDYAYDKFGKPGQG